MENVFDSLCSGLAESEIKNLFLKSEGVDLMVLMMKYILRLFFRVGLDLFPTETRCKSAHGQSKP
jgi:hypothetical protein